MGDGVGGLQSGRLPFQRIAVTLPPPDWFHGITNSLFEIYRQAFIDLGLEVFDVPLDAFLPPDVTRIETLISDLRTFQPDLAFGLSHGLHLMVCRSHPTRNGWRPNLFTDVLDVPTICAWDHAPMDLADQLLAPRLKDPGASRAGARETLRRALTHPRMIHWSRDSGQTRIMSDMGFVLPGTVIYEPAPALPGFVPREVPSEAGVGFVGHVYQEEDALPHPTLEALADDATATWLEDRDRPLWEVLTQQAAGMDAEQRRELALDVDQTYFWHYAYAVILHRAQTELRLKMLGAAGVPVACYGDLRTSLPGVPENLISVPGHIPFGPPLAAALSRNAITLDVMSPGFVRGYSHKPMLTWASGGFLLMDRKQDFVDAFGEAGEAVSYRGVEDLGAQVERFLGNPRYRREVGDAIRERIAARFQLKDVLCRIFHAAAQCMAASAPRRTAIGPPPDDRPVSRLDELLWTLRSSPAWDGSTVVPTDRWALVTTSAKRWMYAAEVSIPPDVSLMREPHLRVKILVEQGAIGLAARLDETGDLLAEQVVSANAEERSVVIELPHQGVSTVILRNSRDGVSRALVVRATLCDRE